MNVMDRPGHGVWIRMLVLAALAYGGSFVVRGITTALTTMTTMVHHEVRTVSIK